MKKNFLLLPFFVLSLYGCGESSSSIPNATFLPKQKLDYTTYDLYKNHAQGRDAIEAKGTQNLLVVPIWFYDSSLYIEENQKETIRLNIQKAYFGTNEETGWRSVKTYYQEDSYGHLTIEGEVTPWYEVNISGNKITKNQIVGLVTEVANWYKQTNDIKPFDGDKDGFIDAICLIYGFPTTLAENVENDNLWAFTSWMGNESNKDVNNPSPNAFFWASYDYLTEAGGDIRNCLIDTHTYIHETGHLLGLEDYYDYSGIFNPIGGWTMQDMNVGSHDPYSKMSLGWTRPYVVKESLTLKIKPFEESGDVILLSPGFRNSPFDEYLLIDYYTPTHLSEFDSTYRYRHLYPKGPSQGGIRVWHVDSRLLEKPSRYSSYNDNSITNKIEDNKVYQIGPTNTTFMPETASLVSPLESLQTYRMLRLLRQETNNMFTARDYFGSKDLWEEGDVFSMEQYADSFENKGKLNSGKNLNYSFIINNINEEEATITFTKH